MKKVFVREEWCLGCHLCEYNCAFANSGKSDMAKALKGKVIQPRIKVEDGEDGIHFAVNCRQCKDPICMKCCIAGALHKEDGIIKIDQSKCVLCYSCIMACPYGCLRPAESGVMTKCELCTNNGHGTPACVEGCPNRAIVFEEEVHA